jgi:hypothetical protein
VFTHHDRKISNFETNLKNGLTTVVSLINRWLSACPIPRNVHGQSNYRCITKGPSTPIVQTNKETDIISTSTGPNSTIFGPLFHKGLFIQMNWERIFPRSLWPIQHFVSVNTRRQFLGERGKMTTLSILKEKSLIGLQKSKETISKHRDFEQNYNSVKSSIFSPLINILSFSHSTFVNILWCFKFPHLHVALSPVETKNWLAGPDKIL